LQRTLDAVLADAERQAMPGQRAWALRKTLDQVRAKLKEGGTSVPEQMPPVVVPAVKVPKVEIPPVRVPEVKPPKVEIPPVESKGLKKKPADQSKDKSPLWERLGGQAKVAKIIDDFTKLATADPKVNFTRNGKFTLGDAEVIHFKQAMIDYLSTVTGGPLPYTGKNMKEIHKGMKITSPEFNAAAADLKKVLQDSGIKKADIDAVLDLVETTRKDIVEVPAGAKSPIDKNGVEKKPGDKKPGKEVPFEQVQDEPTKPVALAVAPIDPLGDNREGRLYH